MTTGSVCTNEPTSVGTLSARTARCQQWNRSITSRSAAADAAGLSVVAPYLNESSRVLEGVFDFLSVLCQGTGLVIELLYAGVGQQHHLEEETIMSSNLGVRFQVSGCM